MTFTVEKIDEVSRALSANDGGGDQELANTLARTRAFRGALEMLISTSDPVHLLSIVGAMYQTGFEIGYSLGQSEAMEKLLTPSN